MPHESLAHVFMAHEMFRAMFSWKIHESLNEMVLFSWKVHGHEYSHGIYFVVFMGHEMPFVGFSLDIHGIFIQLCFIVSFLMCSFVCSGFLKRLFMPWHLH